MAKLPECSATSAGMQRCARAGRRESPADDCESGPVHADKIVRALQKKSARFSWRAHRFGGI